MATDEADPSDQAAAPARLRRHCEGAPAPVASGAPGSLGSSGPPRAGCGAPRSDDAGVQMSWHSPRTEPGPRTKRWRKRRSLQVIARAQTPVAIQERPSATDRLARAVSGGCPIAAPRAASDAIRSPGVILVRMKLLQLQERAQSLPDERSEGVLRGRRVPSECCRKKIGRPVRRRHPERAYRRNRSTNGQGDKERSDEPIHKRARAAAGSPGWAPSGMFAWSAPVRRRARSPGRARPASARGGATPRAPRAEGRDNRRPSTDRSCCSGHERGSRWLPGACASGC